MYQPGKRILVVVVLAAQVCVPFGIVDDDVDADGAKWSRTAAAWRCSGTNESSSVDSR